MDNKVLNKQIPIKTIVDIANYFEEYKERYSDLFQKDQEKNEKLNFADKNYEYRSADVSLMYTIRLRNGKNMKESNYNWFIVQLGQPSIIEEVIIDLRISYFGKIEKDKISRFQTAFPDTLTIFIIDINDCTLQGFVIDILIHGPHES